MNSKKPKSIKRDVCIIVTAFAVAVSLIVTFAGNCKIPSWNKIFSGLFNPLETTEKSNFLRVMDVGQGDGILICSKGKTVMIDTGTSAKASKTCGKIKNCGIKKINALILTHPHADHIGGLNDVIRKFEVDNLIVPSNCMESDASSTIGYAVSMIRNGGGNVYAATEGMNIEAGDFNITILACYSDDQDDNNNSIIVMAKSGDIKFLLTGDCESTEENRLLNENIILDCDVLKVAHHGSSTSTSERFLQACMPRYAAISCGKNNNYSHPHKETLSRLANCGATVFRTDISGDITFNVKDNVISVETEKGNN